MGRRRGRTVRDAVVDERDKLLRVRTTLSALERVEVEVRKTPVPALPPELL